MSIFGLGGKQSRNVLFAGASNAGKTQLLYSLALQKAPEKAFEATRGFNYEKVVHKISARKTTTYELHIFDISGDERLHSLVQHFYNNMRVDVLAFVLDAQDERALQSIKDTFQNLVHERALLEVELILVLNIKDKRQPILDDSEILSALELKKFRYLKPIFCKVNAKEGTGLDKLRRLLCVNPGVSK
eukprot:g2053.t1